MAKRVMRPSFTMAWAPAPPSSAGWKITTAVPAKLRVSARYLAAPKSIAVWPSWPQACILPGTVDWYGRPVSSSSGSASMSARSPTTLPPALRPRMTPTTPVGPVPGTPSSQPKLLSFSATEAAVRCTSYCSSGWACMSRRQAVISSCRSATRLTIGMGWLLAQIGLRAKIQRFYARSVFYLPSPSLRECAQDRLWLLGYHGEQHACRPIGPAAALFPSVQRRHVKPKSPRKGGWRRAEPTAQPGDVDLVGYCHSVAR